MTLALGVRARKVLSAIGLWFVSAVLRVRETARL